MAEEQAQHRMRLETFVVHSEAGRSKLGLFAGFFVALLFLGASFVLVMADRRIEGTIIGTLDIATLAGVFVYGAKTRRDERLQRFQAIAGE